MSALLSQSPANLTTESSYEDEQYRHTVTRLEGRVYHGTEVLGIYLDGQSQCYEPGSTCPEHVGQAACSHLASL